jgi:hypothetical protein
MRNALSNKFEQQTHLKPYQTDSISDQIQREFEISVKINAEVEMKSKTPTVN